MFNQNKYKEFWKWFEKYSELIFDFENDLEKTFGLLSTELKKVDKNLTFEFGPVENNRREFILSANGLRESFGEVEKLFNQKPELEKWKMIKFRPRKESDCTIKINDMEISPKDIFYTLFADGEKIGILVFIEKYNENIELYGQVTFLFLDTLLGEYDVETKVGAIEITDFTSEYFSTDALSLDTLANCFDTVYKDITTKK
ncbi:MAG: hypothetical protein LBC73_09020 [Oscillospiraceae bacterium]|jgi:hypothetical protein|nr:hypothetical protein [Oscillospiraceae bacterium]